MTKTITVPSGKSVVTLDTSTSEAATGVRKGARVFTTSNTDADVLKTVELAEPAWMDDAASIVEMIGDNAATSILRAQLRVKLAGAEIRPRLAHGQSADEIQDSLDNFEPNFSPSGEWRTFGADSESRKASAEKREKAAEKRGMMEAASLIRIATDLTRPVEDRDYAWRELKAFGINREDLNM